MQIPVVYKISQAGNRTDEKTWELIIRFIESLADFSDFLNRK
jgi:hypothetical protein